MLNPISHQLINTSYTYIVTKWTFHSHTSMWKSFDINVWWTASACRRSCTQRQTISLLWSQSLQCQPRLDVLHFMNLILFICRVGRKRTEENYNGNNFYKLFCIQESCTKNKREKCVHAPAFVRFLCSCPSPYQSLFSCLSPCVCSVPVWVPARVLASYLNNFSKETYGTFHLLHHESTGIVIQGNYTGKLPLISAHDNT